MRFLAINNHDDFITKGNIYEFKRFGIVILILYCTCLWSDSYGFDEGDLLKVSPLYPETFVEMYDARDNITAEFSLDEIKLLKACIWGESGNDYLNQIWTAKVLLNRIDSEYFPDTVSKVVYQGQGRQFNAVWRDNFGYYDEDTGSALLVAYQSTEIPNNVVYFANVSLSGDSKFINNVIIPNTIEIVGGHNYAIDTRGGYNE